MCDLQPTNDARREAGGGRLCVYRAGREKDEFRIIGRERRECPPNQWLGERRK